MPDSAQTLTKLGDHVSQLYTLPAVALRVMELTDQADIDVPALKQTVEADPALTAKILRVVNSSIFSRVGEVADLNQALALLGIQPLKLLVLGFSLPSALFEGQDADVLARYWRRSLTKAVAARELTRRLWHTVDDEAFIAGLLDDLGQLVLLQQLDQRYVDFLNRVEMETTDLEHHEWETLGFTHRQLSAEVLRRWQIPEAIVHGIESPRDVSKLQALSAEVARLPQALHLADLVADSLTLADPTHVDSLVAAAAIYRDATPYNITMLIGDVERLVEQLAEVLNTDIGDAGAYRDIGVAAHTRLAAVAENALLDVVCYRRIAQDREPEEQVWDEAKALSECLSTMLKWTVPGVGRVETPVVEIPVEEPSLQDGEAIASDRPPGTEQTTERHRGKTVADTHIAAQSIQSSRNQQVDSVAELRGSVSAAIALCRAKQWALSVVLFDVSVMRGGDDGKSPADLQTVVRDAGRSAHVQYAQVCSMGETRLAWILPRLDRDFAVELARDVVDRVQEDADSGAKSASAGVASVSIPAKNFDARTLVESADRCLYGVLTSGGSGVKSISVF